MIGSFWNLCRACPSMPVDKVIQFRKTKEKKNRKRIYSNEKSIEIIYSAYQNKKKKKEMK